VGYKVKIGETMSYERVCGIYAVENLINGKIYIGQSRNAYSRRREYFHGRCHNEYLSRSIALHGVENFSFRIIEECSLELLTEREKYWILFYESTNPSKGYNMTFGGEGVKPTLELSKKLSLLRTGRVIGPEWRANLKKAAQDRMWITNGTQSTLVSRDSDIPTGWQQGRPAASQEQKRKTSEAMKAIYLQPLTEARRTSIIKSAKSRIGKKLSQATKDKISKSHLARRAAREAEVVDIEAQESI
jgi:group I intron endonuclease